MAEVMNQEPFPRIIPLCLRQLLTNNLPTSTYLPLGTYLDT